MSLLSPFVLDRPAILLENFDDETLRFALTAAKLGVWSLDLKTGEFTCNGGAYKLLGFDEPVERDLKNILDECCHPDDRDLAREAMERAIDPQGSGLCLVEHRIITPGDELRWISFQARAQFEIVGDQRRAMRVAGIMRDVTTEHQAQLRQDRLVDELNHRVKNMLSLVQSVAYQSFRMDPHAAYLFDNFQGRLKALARSHDLLVSSGFAGSSFNELCDYVSKSSDAPTDRVNLRGERLFLAPKSLVTTGLILHELFVNAIKYGALSGPDGRVNISVHYDRVSQMARIEWIERNGPESKEPERKGFGIRLIERAVALEFGGMSRFMFNQGGLECILTMPMHRLQDQRFTS